MHSEYARQGTVLYRADRVVSVMEEIARATNADEAEHILKALERTDMESRAARAIRQALGDLSFETRRYIDSTKSSIRQEETHLRECPDCKHSKARLDRDNEMLEALLDRLDGVNDAYRLFARDNNETAENPAHEP